MLLTQLTHRFRRPIRGIVHVGANIGDEREQYAAAGVPAVLWVEPLPDVFAVLQANIAHLPGQSAVQALCSARAGEPVTLNIASNAGASSSILPLGDHARRHPSIHYVGQLQTRSTTVDALLEQRPDREAFNALVLDVQGAELEVLRGSLRTLEQIDALYVEVSEEPLYEGGCTLEEIWRFLTGQGFRMKWMSLNENDWGDAFFVAQRPKRVTIGPQNPNLAIGCATRQSSYYPVEHSDPVDGVLSSTFGFHTADDLLPWWEVDLGAIRTVSRMRIHNRADGWFDRARNLQVLTSTDGASFQTVHQCAGEVFGLPTTSGEQRPLEISLPGLAVRYIRVQLPERGYLHLNEVEVDGPDTRP